MWGKPSPRENYGWFAWLAALVFVLSWSLSVSHIIPAVSAALSTSSTTLPCRRREFKIHWAKVGLKSTKLQGSDCQEAEITGAGVYHVRELKLVCLILERKVHFRTGSHSPSTIPALHPQFCLRGSLTFASNSYITSKHHIITAHIRS